MRKQTTANDREKLERELHEMQPSEGAHHPDEETRGRMKNSGRELERAHFILQLISDFRRSLLVVNSESEWLHHVCEKLHDSGGYATAGIGFAETDGSIRFAAASGRAIEVFERMPCRWDCDEEECDPAGQAIRSGQPWLVGDIGAASIASDFHAEALQLGLLSVIALPLRVGGEVLGVLCIYADKENMFDEKEARHMESLAEDLSFGIDYLKTHGRYRQSEIALGHQSVFSDKLLGTLQVAIGVLNRQCDIIYINPFLERLSGYTLDEIRGKNWFDTFLVEQDREEIRRLIADYSGNGQLKGHVSTIITKTGQRRLLRWSDQQLPLEEGDEEWLLFTGVDITELEHGREALLRSEFRFRTLIDTLPQGIFLKSPDSVYMACNRSHAGFLGLSGPKEIIGRRDEEFFPPQLVRKYRKDEKRAVRSGKTIDVEEAMVLNGRETTVQSVKTPVRDEAGNITGILGIYWDISERKRTEDEQRRNEALLRDAGEMAHIGGWEFDAVTGNGTWTDEVARIHGLKTDEPVSAGLGLAYYQGESRKRIEQAVREAIENGRDYDLELVLHTDEGKRKWVRTIGHAVVEKNRTVRIRGAFQDVTERKRNEILLQARVQLTDMAPEVDHKRLMRATLDVAEELTDSNIGFFHFVNEDQKHISLQAWSTNTVERMCSAEGAGMNYRLSEAGVWADAVRKKATIIHNDYPHLEGRQGMPEGHAPVEREMSVPVTRRGKVVAVIGVGNKPSDYDDTDIEVVSQLVDFVWDLIEVKMADEELQASRHRYFTLFEAITDAVFVYPVMSDGSSGKFVEVNGEACRYLGYSRDELLDMTPQELDAPASVDGAGEIGGRLLTEKSVTFEQLHVTKAGRCIPVEIHAQLFDLEGHRAVLSLVRDISERKQTETALEKSRRDLAEAQKVAQVGSWELDLIRGHMVWSNEMHEIFEVNKGRSTALYDSFLEVIHPQDRQMVTKAYSDALHDHSYYEVNYRLQMADGRVKYVQERGRIFCDGDGVPLRVAGTIQDISHMHEVEEQLRQAQKMEAIGTLVGGIAHDFNNKLAAITGNLFLAQQVVSDESEAFERLKGVETLSFEAAGMVQQLLAFARKGKVEQSPLTLVSFIKEAAKLNRVAIPGDIHFSVDYGKDPLPIMGDVIQLQQVFLNLLTNARDALEGSEEPRIEVSLQPYEPDADFFAEHPGAERAGAYACMQVSDNGSGIDPAHLEQIFDPFFTTKEVGKGTGLGLAMVYGVVQAHHGIIEVESSPEEGTTFSIYLPLCTEALQVQEEQAEEEVLHGNGELILIADDNAYVRDVFRDVLESLGYRVLVAGDGGEAVEVYRQHQQEIAVVVLDIVMPRLKGPDAARQIRRIQPDVKILYATGYDSRSPGRELPRDAPVLAKPYRVRAVGRMIRDALKGE